MGPKRLPRARAQLWLAPKRVWGLPGPRATCGVTETGSAKYSILAKYGWAVRLGIITASRKLVCPYSLSIFGKWNRPLLASCLFWQNLLLAPFFASTHRSTVCSGPTQDSYRRNKSQVEKMRSFTIEQPNSNLIVPLRWPQQKL